MFGASAAVLHYNVFPRLVTALINRLFGIPLLCFFDDFAALVPQILRTKALQAFATFCSLLGIRLKEGKSEVGPRVTFLCLSFWFPGRRNNYTVHISLPAGKRGARAALLRDYVRKGCIAHQKLGEIIGRLSFSQTLMFGKFARTQIRPLYQKLYGRVYNARLSAAELGVFGWRGRVISSFSPRICRPAHIPSTGWYTPMLPQTIRSCAPYASAAGPRNPA